MPLKTETVDEPTLNLTPMIDIVFLLIIFFMVGTQFTQAERQYDVRLPTVSLPQPLTSLPDAIVVNVRKNGEIVVNSRVRSQSQLEDDLKQAKQNYADQAVVIRGEGEGPYQHIMDVLVICQRAQINTVSLANRLKAEGE